MDTTRSPRRRAGRSGPPPANLSPEEAERLADVRAQASGERAELAGRGPEDPLGRLAWIAGVESAIPEDPSRLVPAIEAARADGHSWKQIAGALGEGDSTESARRIGDRYRAWSGS